MRYQALSAILGAAMLMACGSSTNNIGVLNTGTPGLATGFLVDAQGHPIWGASVWTFSGENNANLLTLNPGQIGHTEFDICHEPQPEDEIEHGTCSNEAGEFEIDCNGTGTFTLHLLNAHGEELPDITAICGSPEATHNIDVQAQPTPCPPDSEEKQCPAHDHDV